MQHRVYVYMQHRVYATNEAQSVCNTDLQDFMKLVSYSAKHYESLLSYEKVGRTVTWTKLTHHGSLVNLKANLLCILLLVIT